jgi:MFS family permease
VPVSPPARATRREWIGLATIALPCLVYAMDLTVLTLAVPALSADLRPSSTEMLWIVDIYGFLVAGLLITMGTLGDRIGRRRLLLVGAGAFAGASVLAALSSSPEMLIAARALLGVAGATIAPSTLSLIRNMFADDQQRTVAIGVWVTSFSTGAAIGPLVGGALIEGLSWNSVFLMAVPVMGLLLALAARVRPPVLMLAGIIVAIAGAGLLTQAQAADGPGVLVAGLVMLSLGLAPLFTLAADIAVGSAPPERAGAASGISETSSELGGASASPCWAPSERPSTASRRRTPFPPRSQPKTPRQRATPSLARSRSPTACPHSSRPTCSSRRARRPLRRSRSRPPSAARWSLRRR